MTNRPKKASNPVARAVAVNRRRSQVVAPKRGKGSYNRNKEKDDARKQQLREGQGKETT